MEQNLCACVKNRTKKRTDLIYVQKLFRVITRKLRIVHICNQMEIYHLGDLASLRLITIVNRWMYQVSKNIKEKKAITIRPT